MVTADAETRAVTPEGLQGRINDSVSATPSGMQALLIILSRHPYFLRTPSVHHFGIPWHIWTSCLSIHGTLIIFGLALWKLASQGLAFHCSEPTHSTLQLSCISMSEMIRLWQAQFTNIMCKILRHLRQAIQLQSNAVALCRARICEAQWNRGRCESVC